MCPEGLGCWPEVVSQGGGIQWAYGVRGLWGQALHFTGAYGVTGA